MIVARKSLSVWLSILSVVQRNEDERTEYEAAIELARQLRMDVVDMPKNWSAIPDADYEKYLESELPPD